jgi:hypothetical protein
VAALAVLLVLGLAGCQAQVGSSTAARGSGTLKTESRSVSGFDRVSLSGVGTLTISQGANESLTIEAEDNLLPLLRSDVTGSLLQIGPRPGSQVLPTRPINYRLAVTRLRGVEVTGAADVKAATLSTDQLEVRVTGASQVDLARVTTASLSIDASGGSDVTVSGQAQRQTVTISGAGKYHASGLSSQEASLDVTGAGDCEVQATDRLSVTITGAGHVAYSGAPTIDEHVTGAGSITKSG